MGLSAASLLAPQVAFRVKYTWEWGRIENNEKEENLGVSFAFIL